MEMLEEAYGDNFMKENSDIQVVCKVPKGDKTV